MDDAGPLHENRMDHDGRPDRDQLAAPAGREDTGALLIAGDIGGTTARIAVGLAQDALPEAIRGPGWNLRSSGPDALAALAATVGEALAGRPGSSVRRAVLAVAGSGPARHAEVTALARETLAPLGIAPERIEVIEDLRAAFVAGGVGDDGVLLLAGTGAVAARYRDGVLEDRIDGMGWLLGDIASAVWLGRRVLEVVAADLDGRGRPTRLTELLGDCLDLDLRDGLGGPTGDPRQDLVRAIDPLTPAQWGRFAPLPGEALPDPVAREILDQASRALAHRVRTLDPGAELPIVLAGAVLASSGPIRDELVCGLEASGHPAIEVASSGLAGAWELARRETP
ncbi:N-acetylglucosamine kinase [Brachybacterium sp. AOP25-B2-12]|uniref:N-acetylglucosamine kinase n=1 Tax=Brachybacterium sp. AOP25-B2-12 TaxID=3457710 RepID=UPI0040345D70